MMACLHSQLHGQSQFPPSIEAHTAMSALVHRPHKDDRALTLIVDYMAGLLKVERVDDFIISIILVSVQILGLTSMTRAHSLAYHILEHTHRGLTSGKREHHLVVLPVRASASLGSYWLW